MDAVVSIPGAEPWSAGGSGERGRVGVVVVHGFALSPIVTRPLGQRLAAEGFTVEVPLLPGHGTNHRDLGRTRYADWFGAVERLLDHLAARCDRVVLIGHAWGGTITLDLASRRPDDVAAVAVINPQILTGSDRFSTLAPVLRYAVPFAPGGLIGLPADDIARPGIDVRGYGLVSLRAAGSLFSELPRIREQLGELVQPLLVAWSPHDHTVPPENARELLGAVGSVDVTEVVCDRSYHVPQLDYDAAKVEDRITTFVAEATGT